MNWIDEAAIKLKKKNQILFSKNSEYLQDLLALFQGQDHRVMTLWAFDFAAESITKLKEKYPEEQRPIEALTAVQDWAAGKVKMRFAQRKILDCHAFAKEIEKKRRYRYLPCDRTSLCSCSYRWTRNRVSNL